MRRSMSRDIQNEVDEDSDDETSESDQSQENSDSESQYMDDYNESAPSEGSDREGHASESPVTKRGRTSSLSKRQASIQPLEEASGRRSKRKSTKIRMSYEEVDSDAEEYASDS